MCHVAGLVTSSRGAWRQGLASSQSDGFSKHPGAALLPLACQAVKKGKEAGCITSEGTGSKSQLSFGVGPIASPPHESKLLFLPTLPTPSPCDGT